MLTFTRTFPTRPDAVRGCVNLTADDGLWQQYDELATRAYGHRVGDITDLREHADLQVAVRGGRVVAGGLGLLVN